MEIASDYTEAVPLSTSSLDGTIVAVESNHRTHTAIIFFLDTHPTTSHSILSLIPKMQRFSKLTTCSTRELRIRVFRHSIHTSVGTISDHCPKHATNNV